MKKIKILVLISIISLLLFVTPASARTLQVGHVLAPTHPYQTGLEKFAELVAEKTDGDLEIQVYHSSQLGDEREMIESLQFGVLDMSLVSTAPLSGFTKKFQVFDLPFIFQTREEAYAVLDGEIGTELLESLEEKNIIGLTYWENGFRHVTNSKRKIEKPGDLKGLKIRLMQNPVHMDSFKAMGALPTPMGFGELFTAMQQGTVDGQENPLPIIDTSKFYEVQEYLSLTGHFYAASPLLVSKSVWQSLSESEQNAIQEAAYEARDFERNLVKKMDNELVDDLKEKGLEITEVDKSIFQEATSSVYDKYEDQIGTELLNRVLNKVKEVRNN